MGLTKFQIKIDRSVYEVLCKMISYAAASVDVIDLSTLFIKETLEDFKRRFDSKKFKLQERFAFSFNSVELYVFCKYVGSDQTKVSFGRIIITQLYCCDELALGI